MNKFHVLLLAGLAPVVLNASKDNLKQNLDALNDQVYKINNNLSLQSKLITTKNLERAAIHMFSHDPRIKNFAANRASNDFVKKIISLEVATLGVSGVKNLVAALCNIKNGAPKKEQVGIFVGKVAKDIAVTGAASFVAPAVNCVIDTLCPEDYVQNVKAATGVLGETAAFVLSCMGAEYLWSKVPSLPKGSSGN